MVMRKILLLFPLLLLLCGCGGGSKNGGDAGMSFDQQVEWLRGHIVPLSTWDPAVEFAPDGSDGMKALAEMIGDARVVGLGESTHGTREIFKMKHRIVKYLRENEGFDIFSIEANMPESYAVNPYVMGGEGDASALVKGMYFWTWSTHEVLDMVEWMREHNMRGGDKISFTGFDMQFPKVSIAILKDALAGDEDTVFELSRVGAMFDIVSNNRYK